MMRYDELLPLMIANLQELNKKVKIRERGFESTFLRLKRDMDELRAKQKDFTRRLARLKKNSNTR
jgi:hypothetical protein